jgi:hypothetical protein
MFVRSTSSALLTIAILLVMSSPVAGDDGIGGRQSVSAPTAEDLRLSAMKHAYAVAYGASRRAGNSVAAFDAQVAELEMRLAGGALPADGYTTRLASRSSTGASGPMVADSNYETHHLAPYYQTQSTQYWCGPASAWNVLYYHATGNSWRGEELTQENLANSNWLNTTQQGTNLGDDPWRKTLNGWTDGTSDGWYLITWAPSASVIANDLAFDVDHYYLLIYDVYMSAGTGKMPGYSGYTEVWHYIAGTGYSNYGNNTDWLDPFTGGSPGLNYDYPVTNLVPMMGSYGMIW